MKKQFVVGLMLSLALPSVALAQKGEPSVSSYGRSGWSVLTGKTVGSGQNALDIEAGWPGVSVGFLHGVSDRVDIGGQLTFNYGLEGAISWIVPGLKPQLVARVGLLDTGKVNLGLTLAPGMLFYFLPDGSSLLGVTIPVGLNLGVAVADSLNLGVSFDLPMWITFGYNAGVAVPVLFGVGVEYFLDRSMALTLKVKLGPTGGSFFTVTEFTFVSQVGLAIKL